MIRKMRKIIFIINVPISLTPVKNGRIPKINVLNECANDCFSNEKERKSCSLFFKHPNFLHFLDRADSLFFCFSNAQCWYWLANVRSDQQPNGTRSSGTLPVSPATTTNLGSKRHVADRYNRRLISFALASPWL